MSFLIDAKLFAANLRYYREHSNYTVRALAERSSLTIGVIDNLESGLHIPNESQLISITQALKIHQEQLVLPRKPNPEYFESC